MRDDEVKKEWIRLATLDLNTAEHLYNTMHPKPLEPICYHCQQAVEKMLKAVLAAYGQNIPKSHDTGFLAEKIGNCQIFMPEKQIDMCEFLTPFGVAVRYPYELDLTEETTKKALHCASAVCLWLTSNAF